MANVGMTFSVCYEDHFKDKLRIPAEFKNVLKTGPRRVDLQLGKYGRVWEATMAHEQTKDGLKTILKGAWADFVIENRLSTGDHLQFNYIGGSAFIVKISKPSGSKKAQVCASEKNSGGSSKRRGRRPAYEGSSSKMIETNEWIDDLARTCQEPHFKFIFTAAYLKRGAINIPVDFANCWFKNFGELTEVRLQNFDEQLPAKLRIVKKDGVIAKCELCSGVRDFTDAYNVHTDEGALIKYQRGNPAVFDIDLVLV